MEGTNSQTLTFIFVYLFVPHELLSFARDAEVSPQDAVLLVGSSLTATCTVRSDLRLHAGTLFWTLNGVRLPDSSSRVVSPSVLSLTLHGVNCSETLAGDTVECRAADGRVLASSCFLVGAPPEKPENLTCLSKNAEGLTCRWSIGQGVENPIYTKYTLKYKLRLGVKENECEDQGTDQKGHFCHIPNGLALLMLYDIWVEAANKVGSVMSDVILLDVLDVVTTDPPTNLRMIRVGDLGDWLTVRWDSPTLNHMLFKAKYQLRYRPEESMDWKVVDGVGKSTSYQLGGLTSGTVYFVQVRCRPVGVFVSSGPGIWSEWSHPTAATTPNSERLQGGLCDPQSNTLRHELKQFLEWVRKHTFGCSDMSVKLIDEWRVWLQKQHRSRNQILQDNYS